MKHLLLAFSCLLGTSAQAYTTRVHMAIANDLRTELVASPDGRTIRLGGDGGIVRLSEDDARAIRDWPLAFRAGAIGPDNFVFPAMTDLTHAVGLRPYDQCEDLYQLAVTDEERAYAMGCFLHGSTDAVAHHYVNWLTGETFTLNPVSHGRAEGYSNVVGHIVAEAMIQEALMEARPDVFEASAMLHAIPDAFVLDAVMHPDSPVWQRMTQHALPQYEAVEASMPDALLVELVASADLAPAEHLAMLPIYLERAHIDLDLVIPEIEAEVARLQDWSDPDGSVLQVGAGPDGQLGTEDDTTSCSVGCPTLYAQYFALVGLLEPQPGGSAMEQIVAELHGDLDDLMPAYVATIAEVSALLNSEMVPGGDGVNIEDLDVAAAVGPLNAWADDVTAIDWDLVANAVLPQWLIDLEAFLSGIGIDLDLQGILQTLIQPRIDAIRDAVLDVALEQAQTYIDILADEYTATEGAIRADYTQRLQAASPVGVDGTILDHFDRSGVYLHAVNIAAVTLAEHRMILPTADEHAGVGPASFDASYTLAWSQPGLCAYLEPAVFPLGSGLDGLLSVHVDGQVHAPATRQEPPVECHAGALDAFGEADPTSCALTDLDTLLDEQTGSVSRAFPPDAVDADAACLNLEVAGLPRPGEPVQTGGGANGKASDGKKGCGCATSNSPAGAWPLVLLLVLAGCGRGGGGSKKKGPDGGSTVTEPIPGETWSPGTWSTGPAAELIAALGDSQWTTPSGDSELSFVADQGLVAERIRPYGPGAERVLRSFSVDAAGVHTRVTTPAGWELSPLEGQEATWQLTVVDGSPRELHVDRGGPVEVYVEGAAAPPTEGLTGWVRAFQAGGAVDDAFCDSGATGFQLATLFDFARGGRDGELVGEDVAAGVFVAPWTPFAGSWWTTDLQGFASSALDEPRNWVVRYTGTLDHPGGDLAFRERDDVVEDGIWVFLGNGVGGQTNDIFLEVHGFLWPDATPDAPSAFFPAGPLDVEVILVRCDVDIVDVDLEISVGGGPWTNAELAPSEPEITPGLFPTTFP